MMADLNGHQLAIKLELLHLLKGTFGTTTASMFSWRRDRSNCCRYKSLPMNQLQVGLLGQQVGLNLNDLNLCLRRCGGSGITTAAMAYLEALGSPSA